jgi:uncharacterized membrane protein
MKKYFFTGLGILLPVTITITILIFLIDCLTKPFIGFTSRLITDWNLFPEGFFFLSQQEIVEYGSRIFIVMALIGITLLLGLITRWFFLNSLIKVFDKILLRIPVVNALYKTCQDIIKALFRSDRTTLKQVVLVPFPRPGVYVLGIMANKSPESCCKGSQKELISVLVPNSPNPTTGFLLMLPPEDLIPIDMKPEEAIKYIVSCGTIIPTPIDTP